MLAQTVHNRVLAKARHCDALKKYNYTSRRKYSIYIHLLRFKLVTGAMKRLAADSTMGRAEAMRLSMLELIDAGAPNEAHPAYWAPFIVVGEGTQR